jgi:hypothetical protein
MSKKLWEVHEERHYWLGKPRGGGGGHPHKVSGSLCLVIGQSLLGTKWVRNGLENKETRTYKV